MPCRHCGYEKANRPRGLCWVCHKDLDIRKQYPSSSKYSPVKDDEPTQEEVDATVAEQMECLPDWWDYETRMNRDYWGKAVPVDPELDCTTHEPCF
jgi:hypothetical protein